MQTPVIEYKNILYATDLSDSGRAAFPYAASIARLNDSNLTVFHVLKPTKFENYLVGYIDEELWSEIKSRDLEEVKSILVNRKRDDAAIKKCVDEFCKDSQVEGEEHPYIAYDIKVVTGDPVSEIIREASDGDYDLVVIGKRGAGLIEEAIMGTTARRVIRHCDRPVMVIPLSK
jgi:nucleotide-binding universal stress UspA family protein